MTYSPTVKPNRSVLATPAGIDAGMGYTYTMVEAGVTLDSSSPTDFASLSGATGKLVIPLTFSCQLWAASAALVSIDFIKRSAANTAGTSTTPTPVPVDSASPAASAVARIYTDSPSALGSAINTYSRIIASAPVNTSAPTAFNLVGVYPAATNATNFDGPLVLRAGQFLCANVAVSAQALTAAMITMRWVEISI